MSRKRGSTSGNFTPICTLADDGKLKWHELVEEKQVPEQKKEIEDRSLVGVTCHVHSKSESTRADDTKCPCGRLIRRHSFDGEAKTEHANATTFGEDDFLVPIPVTTFGQLGQFGNGARFIRCYSGPSDIAEILADLIMKDVDAEPSLLISCFGGAKYFNMTDKLEKEFMKGISQAATTKGVWLLTTGLNSGVSKLIGQDVHRSRLLKKKRPEPTIIGLTGWGTLSKRTQDVLKWQTSRKTIPAALMKIGGKNVITLDWSEEDTLDKYHTHFLLLDDGTAGRFLDDRPRSDFVDAMCKKSNCQALTIIVEGGMDTLEVIESDLRKNRPVIIIEGSGRLANALSALIEVSTKKKTLNDNEVKHQLNSFLPKFQSEPEDAQCSYISRIREIMKEEYRKYLSVFKLERDPSLTDIIFKAVDNAQFDPGQQKSFLEIAVSWNHLYLAQTIPKLLEAKKDDYPELFEQALSENRPVIVDCFLRKYYDPLQTTKYVKKRGLSKTDRTSSAIPLEVSSEQISDEENKIRMEDELRTACAFEVLLGVLYSSVETSSDRWIAPETIEQLDANYRELVGPYIKSLYFEQTTISRIKLTVKSLYHLLPCVGKHEEQTKSAKEQQLMSAVKRFNKPFDKQKMLRELFVWSVYAGYSDIAFVLLLQIESRIAAALIGLRIAQHISLFANRLDLHHTFAQQAKDYEEYARACITACYEQNERLACQVLVRENPLFGDVTCMQIIISSHSIPITNTNCFMHVLTREWFGQMTGRTTTTIRSKLCLLVSLITLGLASPLLMEYRPVNDDNNKLRDHDDDSARERTDKWEGIVDPTIRNPSYWDKFFYFHSAPAVKMSYDFLIYVWFLLVFSYMMLFDMRPDEERSRWTKIYLIITVSIMVLEQFRRVASNYHTRMMERWKSLDLWLAPVYGMPYILFYIGMICYYQSANRIELFTAARIILAIDLELWYLLSLRFVSGIKLLGPKLVMIKNMTYDLMAFIYIIFVGVIAYGVVSRALTMYSTLDFTAKSIFTGVFYQPYWLLYSVVDIEKNYLDGIISNVTDPERAVEATVNHILLAFHMIFINILILNLLIAVFNFTINDVQEKNEYFWRYQRYELTRDYFEKPILAHPPFSLIAYTIWLIQVVFRRGPTFRVFKLLRDKSNMNTSLAEFEDAASYAHARKFVDDKYRAKEEITVETLQAQIDTLREDCEQIRISTDEVKKQVTTRMDWVIKAMTRAKMTPDPELAAEQQNKQ